MVLPPYMSQAIANYYKETGQEDKYVLQMESNKNGEEIREQRNKCVTEAVVLSTPSPNSPKGIWTIFSFQNIWSLCNIL